MSPTLLEFAVAIILIVVAWQIGIAVAPIIMRRLRSLRRDIDEAAEEAFDELDPKTLNHQHKEERTNGTHR
jgi:hypothetical protein